jgi:hypothetical protein
VTKRPKRALLCLVMGAGKAFIAVNLLMRRGVFGDGISGTGLLSGVRCRAFGPAVDSTLVTCRGLSW